MTGPRGLGGISISGQPRSLSVDTRVAARTGGTAAGTPERNPAGPTQPVNWPYNKGNRRGSSPGCLMTT